jgi:hypothetical protein
VLPGGKTSQKELAMILPRTFCVNNPPHNARKSKPWGNLVRQFAPVQRTAAIAYQLAGFSLALMTNRCCVNPRLPLETYAKLDPRDLHRLNGANCWRIQTHREIAKRIAAPSKRVSAT